MSVIGKSTCPASVVVPLTNAIQAQPSEVPRFSRSANSRSSPTGLLPARMHLYRLFLYSTAAIVGATLVNAVSVSTAGRGLESTPIRFTSRKLKDTHLSYVKNSGVCETTPGVTQYSGYVEVGKNMSMVGSFVVA